MCIYCEGGESLPITGTIPNEPDKRIDVTIDSNFLQVFISTTNRVQDFGYIMIPISFCPICGKLIIN